MLFSQATRADVPVKFGKQEISFLRDLIDSLGSVPFPWNAFHQIESDEWASWAELDSKMLSWDLHLKPLEPLKNIQELIVNQPIILLTSSGNNKFIRIQLEEAGFTPRVVVNLDQPSLQEPISLFAPYRQPLPNNETYANHLLDQSRRLVLGRYGISVILLDDTQLRLTLASGLAAEFGRRVVHEITSPESNGVICCRWNWWLNHKDYLPIPEQVIIALLPLASLESPLISSRVEAFKRSGRDWFREFLLPEALCLLAPAVAPIRKNHGRLAILDGRIRRRDWGNEVLRTIEPWTPLHRLLPS